MRSVTCPLFVVHGQQDQLIHCKHSVALVGKAQGPSTLVLPKMMDHNCFDFWADLLEPLSCFLIQVNILLQHDEFSVEWQLEFDEKLYIPPTDLVLAENERLQQGSLWHWVISKFTN